MKTLFTTTLLALGLVVLTGCGTLKPIGPLAPEVPITQQGQPLPGAPVASSPPAIRPTPPAMFVTPSDVDPDNPYLAAQQLAAEFEADRKTISTAPTTVEISRIKGGVKQK
ncbi:MAG: hypothetical protein L0241_23965 [Planctomycetia bacterium]|nr:hypothetical protein [Planctomycetia bacterium]